MRKRNNNNVGASRSTEQKIQVLTALREEIERLRVKIRIAHAPSLERDLQQLIRRESELSADVGFGDH